MAVRPGITPNPIVSSTTIVQWCGDIGFHGGEVALTFDDGPNGRITERILDLLDERLITAAFSIIGCRVGRHPDLVRRVFAERHVIVNHTMNHRMTDIFFASRLELEIDACDRAIGTAIGMPQYRSRFFRPPFGLITPAVRNVCRARRLTIVPLSYFANDTEFGTSGRDTVVQRIVENAHTHGCGMYVLHEKRFDPGKPEAPDSTDETSGEDRSWVPGAANEIIEALYADNFHFVSPADVLRRGRPPGRR